MVKQMETLDFSTGLRRLTDDAPSNFSKFRGALREPARVIVIFDGTFAVEGGRETFVHLLDYDYPRARIQEYSGESQIAAMDAFEHCVRHVAVFCGRPGARLDERIDEDERFGRDRWLEHVFKAMDEAATQIIVFLNGSMRAGAPEHFSVWTEVVGHRLECVDESTPDQSVWALLMGHRYRKRAGGPQRKNDATYRRRRG